MSLLAATLALAAAAANNASTPCSWDHPGRNPFMGDIPRAVDAYTDIPVSVRERLKSRMRAHQYDDVVAIRRDSIEGNSAYDSEIRGMHFGAGKVCPTVSRSAWAETHQESGLVYCEDGHCLLVPAVCRNLSRITRRTATPSEPHVAAAPPPTDELVFDPPGAGNPGGITPHAAPPDSFAGAGGPPTVPGLPPMAPPGWVDRPANPWPGLPTGGGPLLPPSVPAVPEPETWAMAVVGLALLAMRWRRQRRRGAGQNA